MPPWEKYAQQPPSPPSVPEPISPATGPWMKYQAPTTQSAPAPAAEPASAMRYNGADPRNGYLDLPIPGMDTTRPSLQTPAAQAPAAPGPVNPLVDVLGSLFSGAAQGAAETVMFPVTVGRLAEQGGDALFNGADSLVRTIIGAPQLTDAEHAQRAAQVRAAEPITNALAGAQDTVRGAMDQVLYDPQTKAGEYANMIGQFALPGGLPSRATRLAPTAARMAGEYAADVTRNAILPAVAAQGAGDIPGISGTAAEPWAQTIGAIMGGVGGAAVSATNAPEAVLRRAAPDMNDPAWARAQQLQNNSFGVGLTSPESLAQAQGTGNTGLTNLMRLVEGSVEGGKIMAPFFAERPGQVQTAVTGVLDTLAPKSAQPSSLGPRVAEVANNAVRDVEGARTAAVNPLYRVADKDTLAADTVNGILADIAAQSATDKTGIISGPLSELSNLLIATPAKPAIPSTRTPVLGPDGQVIRYQTTPGTPAVPAVPITDIENLDRARKFLRDRAELMKTGKEATTKEQDATVGAYLAQLDGLMEQASPSFAQGKSTYADITQNMVDPIVNGPLGQLANAKTTPQAGATILPTKPLTGSEGELSDTISRLIMQDGGAELAPQLVRQNLADRLDTALQQTQQGVSEKAGANFVKDIAGTPQEQINLYAVLNALGSDKAKQFPELLDVLEATGKRRDIGSPTAQNQAMQGQLSSGGPGFALADLLRSGGGSLINKAGDATKRAVLRNSMTTLAQMFTDPNSVELIQQAIARGPQTAVPEALLRTGVQTAPILSDADRKRIELTIHGGR